MDKSGKMSTGWLQQGGPGIISNQAELWQPVGSRLETLGIGLHQVGLGLVDTKFSYTFKPKRGWSIWAKNTEKKLHKQINLNTL